MITPLVLASAIIAITLSFLSLCLAIWNTIEIQATKRSTHSVIPVGADTNMADLEKKLSDITKGAGANQGDLNRGLFEAGLDMDEMV